MKNKKGFTLTEIMVVVLIIAGLSAISYPLYTKAITKARVAEAVALTEIVREAQQRNLVVNGSYFKAFNNSHVTGRTRLIKGNDAKVVEGGVLKKGLYMVKINSTKNCIVVSYGDDLDDPIFTIYTPIEDSRMWCTEADGGNGICAIMPSLETGANTCE